MTIGRIAATCVVWGLSLALVATTAGCQSRPKGVPEAAQFKKAGKYRIAYTAERDGTVYIVDEWDNTLMHAAPVHQGDRIVVDPDANQVTINDVTVPTKKVFKSDHAIFLLPGAAAPAP